MPKNPAYLTDAAITAALASVAVTSSLTGGGESDFPEAPGDPKTDMKAWWAFCDIYAPTGKTPDGYGGTVTAYAISQRGIAALFKSMSQVGEKMVNGAVRTSEVWGEVDFPSGTDLAATYRLFADGQFYEVLNTAGSHPFSNSGGVTAIVARVGPNDISDV